MLAGMTGLAFHFCIERSLHHSGLTVYSNDNDWVSYHREALGRVGVRMEMGHARPEWGAEYDQARRVAIPRIKAVLDRGVAVVLWGVDYDEYGVVYGYDDEDGVLLVDGVEINPAGASNPVLYENLGRHGKALPWLHYEIPIERVTVDRVEAYRASLAFYVDQMDRQVDLDTSPWRHIHGLPGYEAWVSALESGQFSPFGLRYCTRVYGEAKRFGAQYLAQVARAMPGVEPVAELFNRLAGVYDRMGSAETAGLVPLVREAQRMETEAVYQVRALLA